MNITDAKALLNAAQQEKENNFNNNIKHIVKTLDELIDNGNVVITHEVVRGDLVITIKNKHYRGLRFFQPKVVLTVVYENIVNNRCCYKYESFFTNVFAPTQELHVAKFIVYLYKKLKLNYVSYIP